MSQSQLSPWDALASADPADAKALKERIAELDQKLAKLLDEGLTPPEFPIIEGLRAATQAALGIIDNRRA